LVLSVKSQLTDCFDRQRIVT